MHDEKILQSFKKALQEESDHRVQDRRIADIVDLDLVTSHPAKRFHD
jgi:hypothetical protein